MRDRMTADDLRSVDTDEYLVVDLADGEYWDGAEGRVTSVKEYDSGNVHVTIEHHSCVKIPSDARRGLRFDGEARGARNLDVDAVYSV